MSDTEKRLLRVLTERSFKKGEFRLASGGVSNYYIDGRMTAVNSEGAYLIGEVLYERTRDLGIDAIGGMAVGAVPLATAAVISYHHHGRILEGFWVRDAAKAHGTQKLVEGGLRPNSRVVVVDDVFTKGSSALKAVKAVQDELNCQVVMVLALVDRLQGAAELFKNHGVENYQTVFTIRDFGVDVPAEAGTAAR
jgi:orotate phosphoribosyltransferase